MMFSKIANASIAVVASDGGVLLFFECVFDEEFKLTLFSDSQIALLLKTPEEFDYVFIDMPTAAAGFFGFTLHPSNEHFQQKLPS